MHAEYRLALEAFLNKKVTQQKKSIDHVAIPVRPIQVRTAGENLEDEGLVEIVNAALLPATVMDRHKLDSLWSKICPNTKVNPEVFIRLQAGVFDLQLINKSVPFLYVCVYAAGAAEQKLIIDRYVRKGARIAGV